MKEEVAVAVAGCSVLSLGFLAKGSQRVQQLAAGSPSPRLGVWDKDGFHIHTKWYFPELRILPEVYFYLLGAGGQLTWLLHGAVTAP